LKNMIRISLFLIFGGLIIVAGCKSREAREYEAYLEQGEKLAEIYCSSCHLESKPELLDKKSWRFSVMEKMGPRLGMLNYKGLTYPGMNPALVPNQPAMDQKEWESIVDYFFVTSPSKLSKQEFTKEPNKGGSTFFVREFTKDISSSSIITLLDLDTLAKTVYVGDVNKNMLYQLNYSGMLLDTLKLSSPPVAMSIGNGFVDLTLAGILHPNDLNRGEIVRYPYKEGFQSKSGISIITSLIRPVASLRFDFNYDGQDDYLVCEYGNDFGRLTLYMAGSEAGYSTEIIENVAGSIMVKPHDFNGDGFMDLAALYAQGDEKIMIYYNTGKEGFIGDYKMAARFPSVYGSMYLDLQDMNGDGFMDIIYVNGDNFDYSQILKPYHGIRIFQNDGEDNFEEKFFYPIYGAGKSVCRDFDHDGDIDILVSSNFADMENNPERGIIYLKNNGRDYDFEPYSFEEAAQNQWNTMAVADFDGDGDEDVLIGAMNLANVLQNQQRDESETMDMEKTALLLFDNKTF